MSKPKNPKGKSKFTIITPTLNQGQSISTTIESVLSQIDSAVEIRYLIYDGKSTDPTLSIVRKFAKKHPLIISWESKADHGQADAINKGLRKASGDYVAYINSDDYYLPNAFKAVDNYFRENPAANWVIGNCSVSSKRLQPTFLFKHLWPLSKSWLSISLFNPVNQPSVFLRTTFAKQVGLFNTDFRYAFDYDYWIRAYKLSPPGRIRKDLAMFRVHPASSSSKYFRQQFQEELEIIRKHTNSKTIRLLHQLFSDIIVNMYRLLK